MRIVFMGTPDFAVASLEALYESGHEVVLVVTQPDRPKGRGYTLTPSPVKQFAMSKGTPVISPETLKDESVIKTLEDTNADLFIVTAYGIQAERYVNWETNSDIYTTADYEAIKADYNAN